MNKKVKIILSHGIFSKGSGKNSVDKLAPLLIQEGYSVEQFNYGYIGIAMALISNNWIAKRLAKIISEAAKDYDVIVYVAHSNGCAVGHIASSKIKGVLLERYDMTNLQYVYIAPALGRHQYPDNYLVNKVTVLHSMSDKVLRAAGVWGRTMRRFRLILPTLPYGELGRKGYPTGVPMPYNNISFSRQQFDHGDYFKDENLRSIISIIKGVI